MLLVRFSENRFFALVSRNINNFDCSIDLHVAQGARLTTTPEHFGIIAKLKMLKSHKVLHIFSTPGEIILNECCPQITIPEHVELIGKLKNDKITQGFSYYFQITLDGCCLHFRIPEHLEIISSLTNVNISLDQCKNTIL